MLNAMTGGTPGRNAFIGRAAAKGMLQVIMAKSFGSVSGRASASEFEKVDKLFCGANPSSKKPLPEAEPLQGSNQGALWLHVQGFPFWQFPYGQSLWQYLIFTCRHSAGPWRNVREGTEILEATVGPIAAVGFDYLC